MEVGAPLGGEDARVGLTRLPCRDARRETVEWTVARVQRNIFLCTPTAPRGSRLMCGPIEIQNEARISDFFPLLLVLARFFQTATPIRFVMSIFWVIFAFFF